MSIWREKSYSTQQYNSYFFVYASRWRNSFFSAMFGQQKRHGNVINCRRWQVYVIGSLSGWKDSWSLICRIWYWCWWMIPSVAVHSGLWFLEDLLVPCHTLWYSVYIQAGSLGGTYLVNKSCYFTWSADLILVEHYWIFFLWLNMSEKMLLSWICSHKFCKRPTSLIK
jgi:hypothetical protein